MEHSCLLVLILRFRKRSLELTYFQAQVLLPLRTRGLRRQRGCVCCQQIVLTFDFSDLRAASPVTASAPADGYRLCFFQDGVLRGSRISALKYHPPTFPKKGR